MLLVFPTVSTYCLSPLPYVPIQPSHYAFCPGLTRIAVQLRQLLQERVNVTGARILSFDLVDLSYAQEIAQACACAAIPGSVSSKDSLLPRKTLGKGKCGKVSISLKTVSYGCTHLSALRQFPLLFCVYQFLQKFVFLQFLLLHICGLCFFSLLRFHEGPVLRPFPIPSFLDVMKGDELKATTGRNVG